MRECMEAGSCSLPDNIFYKNLFYFCLLYYWSVFSGTLWPKPGARGSLLARQGSLRAVLCRQLLLLHVCRRLHAGRLRLRLPVGSADTTQARSRSEGDRTEALRRGEVGSLPYTQSVVPAGGLRSVSTKL